MALGARVTDLKFTLGEHRSRSGSCGGGSRCGSSRRTLFARTCRPFGALLGIPCPTLLRSGRFRSGLWLSTCYLPVAVVVQYVLHDLCHLLFQPVDEKLRRVFMVLDVAELLLPDTREFTTGEQLFVNCINELDTRGGSHEILTLSADLMSLEQGLNDAGARRRASDTVFLHRRTQLLVVDKLTSGLHGTQQ